MKLDNFENAKDYLQIANLNKFFGDFQALKDITLNIKEGEFVCFLGPSGCGKTTLLRAIAGLDIQTSGTIIQDGKDVSNFPPNMRDFGIVFQSYALFPNLTATENVVYGLQSMGGMTRKQLKEKGAELLELVGIPDKADKYPSELSGGQQQRVALARALAMSPGLLLLDEPLSALDAQVRTRLREELRDLQRRVGITTIMVTHDQTEALAMANRVLVMDYGTIEQYGTPHDVYSKPTSSFVARFIGEMNMFTGIVEGPDRVRVGDVSLECIRHEHGKVGTKVRLCIRPDDVDARVADTVSTNVIDVSITDSEFLGGLYTMKLECAALGGQPLSASFSSNAQKDLDLIVGKSVKLSLPSDRLHVYPMVGK